MPDNLKKVAIVTGAASGLGRDLCFRLASKNILIVVADLNSDGSLVSIELNKLYQNSSIFQECDVTSKSDIKRLFEVAKRKFGRIDIVVNNAGIAENGDFLADSDPWELVLNVDVKSVIIGTKMAINEFLKSNTNGVVVNTASMAGLNPVHKAPVYAGAKAFVVNFTRSLGHFRSKGIRINCVCPFFVRTNLTAAIDSKIKRWVPISLVTDAFMLAIENQELAGEAIRITVEKGIDIYKHNKLPKL